MLTLTPVGGSAFRIALSADGGRVCVIVSTRKVLWAERPDWGWHPAPGPGPNRGYPRELALHPDRPLVAVVNAPHVVALSDLAAGAAVELEPRARPGDPCVEPRVAFTPDGRELLGLSAAGLARWRVGDWTRSFAPFHPGTPTVYAALHLAPTGRLAIFDKAFFGAGASALRFLAHPADDGVRASVEGFGGPDGAFSADGRRFTVLDWHGPKVRTWDADTGAALATVRPRGRLSDPVLTPDGHTVLIGLGNAVVGFDTDTGRQKWALDWDAGRVTALAVSGDSLTAAAGTNAGNVVLWDLDG